jgi:hypothetical protein
MRGWAGTTALGMAAVMAVAGCGSSSQSSGGGSSPPDPVQMALAAPGVRTVLVPQQRGDLTIVVPPCASAKVVQESADIPPGSNQVVVPKASLAQTVAVQPCVSGQTASSTGAGTVVLSPGGAGKSAEQAQTQKPSTQNQLVIPDKSDIQRVIVPPCIVQMSSSGSSGSSSSGGGTSNTLALPATGGEKAVTAPPCEVMAASSSSSSSSGG